MEVILATLTFNTQEQVILKFPRTGELMAVQCTDDKG
jgi:hypothetical protein